MISSDGDWFSNRSLFWQLFLCVWSDNDIVTKVVIFDIDGVVVDSSVRHDRLRFDYVQAGDYRGFIESLYDYNKDVADDVVIDSGVSLLEWVDDFYSPDEIVFSTARMECGRGPTFEQLKMIWPSIRPDDLFMMPDMFFDGQEWLFDSNLLGPWVMDALASVPQKRRVIEELRSRDWEVVLAVDDHPEVCDLYTSMGVPVLRPVMNNQILWKGFAEAKV